MSKRVYRSAQGKMVDLGTLILQNEHVRAVGNMGVNARGDKIDSLNRVIETKTEQIQKHNERLSTNVTATPPQSSSRKTREGQPKVEPQTQFHTKGKKPKPAPTPDPIQTPAPAVQDTPPPPVPQVKTAAPPPPEPPKPAPVPLAKPIPQAISTTPPPKSPASSAPVQPGAGGLAGAIARTREIKQSLDRTRRQQAQDSGLKKI